VPQSVPPLADRRAKRRKSIILVLICTFLGAAAQILFKQGGLALPPSPTLWQLATCVPLIAGYGLYGLNLVLLSFALRHGELSNLYPVISLTYVWVMALSVGIFNEQLNPYKLLGVLVIMAGVAVLGRAGSAEEPPL
jgi:multidrug transporter EmrE-like cation transporter